MPIRNKDNFSSVKPYIAYWVMVGTLPLGTAKWWHFGGGILGDVRDSMVWRHISYICIISINQYIYIYIYITSTNMGYL